MSSSDECETNLSLNKSDRTIEQRAIAEFL